MSCELIPRQNLTSAVQRGDVDTLNSLIRSRSAQEIDHLLHFYGTSRSSLTFQIVLEEHYFMKHAGLDMMMSFPSYSNEK